MSYEIPRCKKQGCDGYALTNGYCGDHNWMGKPRELPEGQTTLGIAVALLMVFALLSAPVAAFENPPIVEKAPKGTTMSLTIWCYSHSMGDLLNCGDKIYGRWAYKGEKFKVGDIVILKRTYHGTFVTHRITEVLETAGGTLYLTKGDANAGSDGWVQARGIRAVVIGIKKG